MNIVIINGSPRKHGSTAQILMQYKEKLLQHTDVTVHFLHVADMELKQCVGCCKCYESGHCIFQDDIEQLSTLLARADGVLIGTPTYASNVSGQLKTIIDRGHLIMEQLLYKTYVIPIVTYENYGGKDCMKILKKVISYAGASISGCQTLKIAYSTNPQVTEKLKKDIQKKANRLYHDIQCKHQYTLQKIVHYFIFHFGIRPFVLSKGNAYAGVLKHWKGKQLKAQK